MTYNYEEDSEKLLLVKGKEVINDKDYARVLAKAIDACVAKHGKAILRCVGKIATDNAVRAICISRYNSIKRGQIDPSTGGDLITIPESVDVSFDDLSSPLKGVILSVSRLGHILGDEASDSEDSLLRVKGLVSKSESIPEAKREKKAYINNLSEAILSCLEKYSECTLRYRGYGACDNSIRSLLMAIENYDDEEAIGFQPAFTTIKMTNENGESFDCSAVSLRVIQI